MTVVNWCSKRQGSSNLVADCRGGGQCKEGKGGKSSMGKCCSKQRSKEKHHISNTQASIQLY